MMSIPIMRSLICLIIRRRMWTNLWSWRIRFCLFSLILINLCGQKNFRIKYTGSLSNMSMEKLGM